MIVGWWVIVAEARPCGLLNQSINRSIDRAIWLIDRPAAIIQLNSRTISHHTYHPLTCAAASSVSHSISPHSGRTRLPPAVDHVVGLDWIESRWVG